MSDIKDKILKKAGKKGKTKVELAAALSLGYSTVSQAVNELVKDGKLTAVGKTKHDGPGRPASTYGVVWGD